jgi:hypothetical protein
MERGFSLENLVGRKFGRLTVVSKAHMGNNWICHCECGNEKIAFGGSLKNGGTRSCGCLRKETARKTAEENKKHGMNGTRLYTIWGSMLKRCRSEADSAFPSYGGRGIAVCPEWYRFENFYSWATANGYSDKLTLDRKDNNGGYCPENCHWTTAKAQGNNKRNNHRLTIDGETHTVAEWAEISGTKRVTITARLRRGKDEKTAVFGERYKV